MFSLDIVDFRMASVTNPVHISVQRPQISSLFLLPRRVSTSYGLSKSRELQLEAKDSSLVFSPLVQCAKKKHVGALQVLHSGKALSLKQRRFLPVVAALAADADDSEIKIPDGLELHMFGSIIT